MRDPLYLYFDGLEHPLRLTGCEHLTDYFPTLFSGWNYRPGEPADNPVISICFEDGSYYLSSSRAQEPERYSDKVDTLCALVADLALACSHSDPEALYLHAASVVINGRLVVFPSQYRAGKSFLTTCLVAAGHRYFGDDVFPLTLGECKGRAPGFAPRLRLPLPGTTDAQSKDFIDSHMALAGKRYAYLGLDEASRIPRDELVDIGAFVLLMREEGIPAQLEELPVASVLQQLIKQNFAREVEGARILATLAQAVSGAQCVRLRYDRADEAVRLLTEHFASWPSESNLEQQGDWQLEAGKIGTGANAQGSSAADSFVQNQQAQKISIEGESFLASPDGKAVYHLNAIGSGIWELLAVPTSREEIISVLEMAFPGIERSTIENDVTKILGHLQATNLVCHQR